MQKDTTASPIEKAFWEEWIAYTGNSQPYQLVPQYQIEKYRVDFAHVEFQTAIELDGHATHSSPDAIAYDRKRQREIEATGWKVIRFGGKEIFKDVKKCVKEAAMLLRQEAVESVCDADKRYFELNPDKRELARPFYPEECSLEDLARFKSLGYYPHHVVVRKETDNLRIRSFMISNNKAIGMVWDGDTQEVNEILRDAAIKTREHSKKTTDNRKAKQARKQSDQHRKQNRGKR